jgi:hypothetical protein
MKHLLCISFLFAVITTNAQERTGTFEIKLNGKTIVRKQAIPNGAGIPIALTAKQLAAGGKLQLKITDADNYAEWKRKLMLNDVQENEIKTLEKDFVSGTYDWNITDLKPLLQKSTTLNLFTYCTPIDENRAALIRIRRFHLITFTLKK